MFADHGHSQHKDCSAAELHMFPACSNHRACKPTKHCSMLPQESRCHHPAAAQECMHRLGKKNGGLPLLLLVGISLRLIQAATSYAFLMRLDIALLCPVRDQQCYVQSHEESKGSGNACVTCRPRACAKSEPSSLSMRTPTFSALPWGSCGGWQGGWGGPSASPASSLVPACNEEEVLQVRNGNTHGKCSTHVNGKHRRH